MSEKLLACPFCGDEGEKGRQTVTQMHDGNKFDRIICCVCGAMCPEHNWNRRELESASQPGGGEAEDIIERFKNPMTPYGMLIRALRIVAGTTLMDMANHIGITPAHLSAIETGRKPLFHEDVVAASGYFHGLGIPGTLIVLERAYSVSKNASVATPSAGNGGAEES